MASCEFCKTETKNSWYTGGAPLAIDCPRCGEYIITLQAVNLIKK